VNVYLALRVSKQDCTLSRVHFQGIFIPLCFCGLVSPKFRCCAGLQQILDWWRQ
jgi:hypothetical protein